MEKLEAAALFIFIGAQAVTHWLPHTIVKGERNFIITGTYLKSNPGFKKSWKLKRDPYLLKTSIPGVFAAGDVRSGAMNRVASAVGEGVMTISMDIDICLRSDQLFKVSYFATCIIADNLTHFSLMFS
jgi:thioredoxin reductase (NADPH)